MDDALALDCAIQAAMNRQANQTQYLLVVRPWEKFIQAPTLAGILPLIATDKDRARRVAENLIESRRDHRHNAEALLALGVARAAVGLPAQARDAFDQVLRLRPDDPRALSGIAALS